MKTTKKLRQAREITKITVTWKQNDKTGDVTYTMKEEERKDTTIDTKEEKKSKKRKEMTW